MFDLDKAIKQWRRSLSQRRVFSEEDLEELESHVRDHVQAARRDGLSEKEAFHAAVNRVGNISEVADEYRKLRWQKARMRGKSLRHWRGELTMIASYAKVGLRNLLAQPAFTAINVAGLAIGLACCILIALFVRFELSYDRHNEYADRVYRIARQWNDDQNRTVLALARIARPIGPAMQAELPEVEKAVRLMKFEAPLAVGDTRFLERNVFLVDSTFFDVFSVSFVRGDPQTALNSPNRVVITEAAAERYFADADPIGKTVSLFDTYDLEVEGVIAPMPDASHFHPDFLISFGTSRAWTDESEENEWGQYNNYATYVRLADGADLGKFKAKLPAFVRSHYVPDNNTVDELIVQPLISIHLDSRLDSELEPGGNRNYVMLFAAVALLVLLIACFNFINLSTARSSYRRKEVCVRKALGAERGHLVRQFLGESLLLTTAALVIAALLVYLVGPEFERLTGRPVGLGDLGTLGIAGGLAAGIFLVAVLAGAYPALYLAKFQAIEVFSGRENGAWKSLLRSSLVVAQFTISIVLIVGMGVVLRQVSFVQNKDLGFQKDRLVVLPASMEMRRDFERFRQQLEASPLIESATASKLVPSGALVDHVGVQGEVEGEMKEASLALNPVDHAFVDTYGMRLAAGRTFSKQIASDSTRAVILNQAAVRLLGWPSDEAAIGKPFTLQARSFTRPGTVIGVVEDFHFESLRNQIAPLILFIMPERFNRVTVRIDGSHIDEALEFLEERWASYRPNLPFTYSFVDDDFGALYDADRRVGALFSYFAFLALAIAALGLLGLSAFVTEKRRKEIGIRKVLGASVASVVQMLSLDFLRLVAVAFVLACPLAFFMSQWWLARFAYRTDPALWLFAAAGMGVAAVALVTVSIQSIRSAVADPVMSLRQE